MWAGDIVPRDPSPRRIILYLFIKDGRRILMYVLMDFYITLSFRPTSFFACCNMIASLDKFFLNSVFTLALTLTGYSAKSSLLGTIDGLKKYTSRNGSTSK